MLRPVYSFLASVALAIALVSIPAAARAELTAGSATLPEAPLPEVEDASAVQASYAEPMATGSYATTTTTVAEAQPPSPGPVSGLPMGTQSPMGQLRGSYWQPFVGAETVFLAPVHNTGGGGANYTFTDGTTTTSFTASSVNGMAVTPRLWMGLMNDRWGIGVRYWNFANDPAGAQFPAATSQGVYSQGMLKLETFDLEAIRRFHFNNQQLWFSVGVRQAQFSRNSAVTSADYFNHALYFGSASSGARFSGVGVTASLYALRPIGDSNWNLFYGGRASYLSVGNSQAFAQTSASYTSNSGGGAWSDPNGALGNGDAFIGEVQLGLQYHRALESLPATVFFRFACEYQYWHVNNGCSATSNSNAGPVSGNSLVSVTSSAGNSNLGLLGFGIATGFMW